MLVLMSGYLPLLKTKSVVVVIEVGRAWREERVLAEVFGPEYQPYRSRTWF
jgi:protein-S-isoprenylcysteine O-methyltransferase Ste14